jgi:hypothetical protein
VLFVSHKHITNARNNEFGLLFESLIYEVNINENESFEFEDMKTKSIHRKNNYLDKKQVMSQY